MGRASRQEKLFSTVGVFGDRLTGDSFYSQLRQHWEQLFCDDDFCGLYAVDGRRSYPPSVMMRVMLLQVYDQVSDREASRRTRVDLDWRATLAFDIFEAGIAATTLSLFRNRMLIHNADREMFERLVAKAVAAGVVSGRSLAAMDSSPVVGAAARDSAYQLVRKAMRRVVAVVGLESLDADLAVRVSPLVGPKKPVVDWNDPGVRRHEFSRLVTAAQALVAAAATDPDARDAVELLELLVAQEVQWDPDTGQPQRRGNGSASDRVVSATDPEMRHGRSSSRASFIGYKVHVLEDLETEMVLAIDIAAANAPDNAYAATLIQAAQTVAPRLTEVVADTAYGDADTRLAVAGLGTTVVAPLPPAPNFKGFSKDEFIIDPTGPSVTCPAGITTTRWTPSRNNDAIAVPRMLFSADDCAPCELRSACVPGAGPRTLKLHPHEDVVQAARTTNLLDLTAAKLRRRGIVERKIDHLKDRGLRKTRYRGMRKTLLAAYLAATVTNFKRAVDLGILTAAPQSAAAA